MLRNLQGEKNKLVPAYGQAHSSSLQELLPGDCHCIKSINIYIAMPGHLDP